ncbi:hypothetical protein AB0K09_05805 [Streptomyces sp. NPDC049577]|uniref:hypothetical protein n=1 Tax=Streptomyces sp. NPDC049577 TaxID=3155153 RepID=UPI003440A531
MAVNPNWPLIAEDWAPYWNCNGGTVPIDRYVEVTDRTKGSTSVQRGRQYELDQVRTAEYQVTLSNTDGALDPLNATGPWFGHIMPYQPYRKRAQWPPTQNLLTEVTATGGDQGGFPLGPMDAATAAGPDVFTNTDPSGTGQIVTDATAWQGARVFQFSVPSGTTAPTRIAHTLQYGVIPGQTYTMQMRVRNVTPSTSLQVKPLMAWYQAGVLTGPASFVYGSNVTLTGSPTASWTLITITATAPANAAGIDLGVAVAATAAATCNVQADGWQLEKGSTATAWTAPGTWYPLFNGFVERWAPRWTMGGTYSQVEPVCVDAFSLLSQVKLSDPLTEEINSHAPRFLFKLDDPQGATSFADATGTYPAAQIGVSKAGAGSLTSGNQITAASPTGTYTGSSGTVVTINNPDPGTNLISEASFINLTGLGIKGPANPGGTWSRMFAFRYTGPTPSSMAVIWSCFDLHAGGGSSLYWKITPSGLLQMVMSGPTNNVTVFQPSLTPVTDANWHLVIASYNHTTAQLIISLDGGATFWYPVDPTIEPTGLVSDSVGGWIDPTTGNGSAWQYKGDLSFVAEFPTALSSTDCANLYSAWKSACAGESTSARYARILRYAGYTGVSSIQAGLTTSMGPAAIDDQDAVSALQAVVDTENGQHFVDRAGHVTFLARSARYNATTPVYVFGENTAAGELPYQDCQLDFDSTHLSNQVTVTQAPTNQLFYAQDATSITNFFPRTLTRTINSNSALECQDAANYLLSRYKNPATRVAALRLHPSAYPALWPVCLNLELGMRVRVVRRPPGVPAITVDCFVEQIQTGMDDQGEAFWTLQCSPADLTPYGLFAAWHTTLKTSTAAGVSSITVNASQDTTNPLAAQLAPGQQIVLGQGAANQETVTVSAVGATSPGWTQATLTLTAATTKAHTAGDVICEPLPAGITDPATWDTVSAFDSVAFAY